MFLISDSDFQCDGSERTSALTTAGILKVRISKCKQTSAFDDYTVMLLSEDIFALFFLPNFEFNILDLW